VSGPIPPRGRVLGVDLGEVRIGLAVTDPAQTVATPLDTLSVQPEDDPAGIAEDLAEAADAHLAVGIVLGLPRTLDGREGPAAHRARDIAGRLPDHLAVDLWDERFSTTEAERVMIEQGARRRERRRAIDRVAATLILQTWLDARRHGRP